MKNLISKEEYDSREKLIFTIVLRLLTKLHSRYNFVLRKKKRKTKKVNVLGIS
jgi:hypothetical protein